MKNQPNLHLLSSYSGAVETCYEPTILPTSFNKCGEAELINAPKISIAGNDNTPQQFFHYQRTRDNVEYILSKIDFDENFPLFVHEEHDCLFIQVGIIGHENYPKDKETKVRPKIVYGRRWYIEPYTPTSEVIQTAYLALIKAREHELREYFHFYIDNANSTGVNSKKKTHRTTPFNTHMDLPLMAQYSELFCHESCCHDNEQKDELAVPSISKLQTTVSAKLKNLRLGKLSCNLTNLQLLTSVEDGEKSTAASSYLLSITIDGDADACQAMAKYFPEQVSKTHHLIIEQNFSHNSIAEFTNRVYHELFNSMLKACTEHVAAHFTYDGFARFDGQLSIERIAQYSAQTRLVNNEQKTERFQQAFKLMVATVDSEKAPLFAKNEDLYHKQTTVMARYETTDGYLPRYQL